MFRPSIQKTKVLVFIALINLILFYMVSNSVITEKTTNHDQKIKAATDMKVALSKLKKYGKNLDLVISSGRDPFNTRMIFSNSESSPLVTDLGKYEAKATVLKPNFSALVIHEFEKANLQKGDTVAISMTGSMPGANLAVLLACEAMELEYVSISSLGASTSGATDMNLSWPKMEKILFEDSLISHVSNKFTYGGRADYLKKGSSYRKLYGGDEKRNLLDSLMQSIYPDKDLNELFLLYGLSVNEIENDTSAKILKTSINNRINLYESECSRENLSCYKAYINIGGGVASFGYKGKKKLKGHYGFVAPNFIREILPSSRSKRPSVMVKFAEEDIPTISFVEIEKLINQVNINNDEWSIAYFNEDFKEGLDTEGNGKWDEVSYKWTEDIDAKSEDFTDLNKNGKYDPPEPFKDKNKNKKWDNGEDFTDLNQNKKWDDGEPFIDRDGMIDIGKGNLFYSKRFDMLIVWIAFFISASITTYIGLISYRQINRQMRDYNPDV
tara:strand:+ start:1459 stop:2952 length:1494 start_codon:yes stop_codon:yes gene_type:complete